MNSEGFQTLQCCVKAIRDTECLKAGMVAGYTALFNSKKDNGGAYENIMDLFNINNFSSKWLYAEPQLSMVEG